MIYQNGAWRKETGLTLDPTGKPLEPVVLIKKGSIYKGGSMKKFKALTGNGTPIITVAAENIEEARKEIHEQLRRPGRFDYFGTWTKGGYKVKESEVVRGDHFGAINPELLKEKQ